MWRERGRERGRELGLTHMKLHKEGSLRVAAICPIEVVWWCLVVVVIWWPEGGGVRSVVW